MDRCRGCKQERELFWTTWGKRCAHCGSGSFLQLLPSPRQQKRFSFSFTAASFAEVVFLPLVMPTLLLASLWVAFQRGFHLFWRMLLGVAIIIFLWVFLFPSFLEEPSIESALILSLLASSLLFFQAGPALLFSRELLLLGRGRTAGWQLASGLFVTLFSLLTPYLILIFA